MKSPKFFVLCLAYDKFAPVVPPTSFLQETPSMADLKAQFEKAQADVKKLDEDPGNAAKLKLYALFKQASAGDVEGKRPGMMDMVGRAKWDAWNEVKGMSADDAMQAYIDYVEELQG
jgi:diazepam-binding inhibitor (GABA receptor modulator, acyl-CoA-binding protein)